MIEIIRRREGERHQKEQITGHNVQVSFNDWGHLAVRFIQDESDGFDSLQCDTIIVFDAATTRRIINFCQKINYGRLPEKLPF